MCKIRVFIIFALISIVIAQKPKCPPVKRNELCRVPAREQTKLSPRGSTPPEGYYPWYAAIYYNTPDKMLFRCAGSIISEKVILTVAECFEAVKGDIPNNELLVQVGSNKKYLGGQFFKVFLKTKSINFETKIAAIILEESIKYTNSIRPVCIEPNHIVDVLRSQQWVPGYDKYSKVGSELVHQELEPSEENQDCVANKNIYQTCLPSKQGVTNCLANSGTGLVFQVSGQWSIRGVASTIIYAEKDKNFTVCHDQVWFEDVTTNYDWIKNTIISAENQNFCHAHLRDSEGNGTIESEVPAGYYPWHVSIFEDNLQKCGGSIITSSLVITAASCFLRNQTEIPNEKLSIQTSNEILFKVLSKSFPSLSSLDFNIFKHNIGILKLNGNINFSIAIRPICLSSIPFEHYPTTDLWGVGTHPNRAILNHKIVELSSNNDNCVIYPKSFCKAPVTGATNCFADYGSGVVFKAGKQWILKGIAVLLEDKEPNELNCSMMLWVIDMSFNFDWILSEIKRLN